MFCLPPWRQHLGNWHLLKVDTSLACQLIQAEFGGGDHFWEVPSDDIPLCQLCGIISVRDNFYENSKPTNTLVRGYIIETTSRPLVHNFIPGKTQWEKIWIFLCCT